jgi:hypothetical protein
VTKAELIELLAEYPDDTPVFIGRCEDLKSHHVSSMNYDDWANAKRGTDEEGVEWEIPAVGVGIHIGRML